jgi:hypothetical protein
MANQPTEETAHSVSGVGSKPLRLQPQATFGSIEGVPSVHRQLAGDDSRAAAVAVLQDLQQVVAGGSIDRLEAPDRRG